jgi:hypothetical protein
LPSAGPRQERGVGVGGMEFKEGVGAGRIPCAHDEWTQRKRKGCLLQLAFLLAYRILFFKIHDRFDVLKGHGFIRAVEEQKYL